MITIPEGLHGAHRRADLENTYGIRAVRREIAEGRLVGFSRFVLVERARAMGLLTRAAAAVLLVGPGAVLSGHTAALLHGCTAADSGTVHLRVPHGRWVRPRNALAIHHGGVPPADVVELSGLPVHALEAAVAELLASAPRDQALAVADQALATVPPRLRARFRSAVGGHLERGPHPRGRERAWSVLALATGLPASPRQSHLLLALADEGLPLPTPQYPVRGPDGVELCRLDLAWPEERIALNCAALDRDRDRDLDLDLDRDRDPDRDLDRAAIVGSGVVGSGGGDHRARDLDVELAHRGWRVIPVSDADLRVPYRMFDRIRSALAERAHAGALR